MNCINNAPNPKAQDKLLSDYKNSAEGRRVRRKYADIIDAQRPAPAHPRMSLAARAKIFSPFAALSGYAEEIAAQEKEHGEE